jgi:hypothetical protein
MRKLVFALATFGAASSLAWASSATIPAPGPNYSPIEKAACGGPGPRCPWGRTWVCGPAGCWCAPCGRGYWYRPWRYYALSRRRATGIAQRDGVGFGRRRLAYAKNKRTAELVL